MYFLILFWLNLQYNYANFQRSSSDSLLYWPPPVTWSLPFVSLVQVTGVTNVVHLHNSLCLVALNVTPLCTLSWPSFFFLFRYGCYHPHHSRDSVECGMYSVSIWLQQQPIWFKNLWNVFSETVFNIRC